MKRNVHTFLIQFLAAYNSNKSFVIVPKTSAAFQCLPIFHHYGLISHYNVITSTFEKKLATGASPTEFTKYLIIWFKPWSINFTFQNQERGAVMEKAPHVPHSKGAHKLEIVRYPSRKHYKFITHRELKNRLPYGNTIYILETARGIISSEEALRYRIGGVPILIIYLLYY